MKRGLRTAIILSASLAFAGCNPSKPAMVKKTPAEETIMDSGLKEIKKPENKPESKLTTVFSKTEPTSTQEIGKEPAKSAAAKAPVQKQKGKAKLKIPKYDMSDFKPTEPPKSDYNPLTDHELLYPVDENGVRLDKKKATPAD